MHIGKTVFAKLMIFKLEHRFQKCVGHYNGDSWVKNFSCREQIHIMSFSKLIGCESLSDIESCLTTFCNKLYHSSIKHPVSKSTLVDANAKRDRHIYSDFAEVLIKKIKLLYFDDNDFRIDIDNMVYVFDCTTIDLCLCLYPWAKFHHQKGAVKMHTLLDLRGSITIFADVTKGAVHDINSLDKMPLEPGCYNIMDIGHFGFHRLNTHIHQSKASFVSRGKDCIKYESISFFEIDKTAGIISDQIVRITDYKSSRIYPEEFRLVVYEYFESSVVYSFITNDFNLSALTIAELYLKRWEFELFFKYIKQNLHIKAFYGTSPNEVYCQIWIAICTYLLIAVAKMKLDLAISLCTFAQTMDLHLFLKTPINEFFNSKFNFNNLSDESQL